MDSPHGLVVYHVASCVRGPGYDSRSRRHIQNVYRSRLGPFQRVPGTIPGAADIFTECIPIPFRAISNQATKSLVLSKVNL